MTVPWQAITHFQMAISNCAMVHQLQQQPELAAGLQQQVASQQLQAALHGGLQVGMPVQRPLPGPGQVSFARCHSLTCTSQGLSLSSHQLTPRNLQAAHPACLQQLQSNCEHTSIVLHAPAQGAPMSQGLAQQAQAAMAAQQPGTGMGALVQQQGGLQGMSQVYGQQQAVAGSLQQQAGLQAVLANFQQQQLQQQQAQGTQQQPPTLGQQRGVEAQQQQQQALAEQAGRAHQAMVDALSAQQLGAGSLQNPQQQHQQELWQEEHQQQGLLQLQQGRRDAEAGEAFLNMHLMLLALWLWAGTAACHRGLHTSLLWLWTASGRAVRMYPAGLCGAIKCSMHALISDSSMLWSPLQPV